MPFLHTWSLSIEEQFYIIFPILLIVLVRKVKKYLLIIIALLSLSSLTLWFYGNIFFQTATFYLPITRAWELLAGAFLAIYVYRYGFFQNKNFSALGLLIIFFSFYLFGSEGKLKNLFMVLPVIGTLLILSVRKHYSLVKAILMNRVSVFFGLISYSLYLFHQPIFAFAKIYFIDLEFYQILFFLILSIFISYISWKYFERIFRTRYQSRLNFSKTLISLSFLFLLSIFIGIQAIKTDGNRSSYLENLNYEESQTHQLLEDLKAENETDAFIDNGKCVVNANDFTDELRERILECKEIFGAGILFFGDSHAKDIFNSYQYTSKREFIIGLTANFCQAHEKINHCYFPELGSFIKEFPEIFEKIYFHQAGYFFLTENNKELNDKYLLEQLPLNDSSTVFGISRNRIQELRSNLDSLFNNIIIIGPRLEPHIQTKYIKKYSCNHKFNTRENLDDAFYRLDKVFIEVFNDSAYLSLQEILKFSIDTDLLNCNEIYWSDADHWSRAGEKKFGKRIKEVF